MVAPLAVFRCDATPAVGGGHVSRCLALAGELARLGWRVGFASAAGSAAVVPTLARRPYDLIETSGDAGEDVRRMRRAWPDGVALLVVDHYGLDASFERKCRPWAGRVLVVDDLADRPHDADWLLDQTPGRAPDDYAALVPSGARLLVGPRFALLRPAFARRRPAALRRRQGGPVRRILVAMGASAPADLMARVLAALDRPPLAGIAVDVVLGSASPALDEIRRRFRRRPGGGTASAFASDMARRMTDADLAVGAAGVTSLERCCLGLPSVVIVTAHNQEANAQALAGCGAAVNLGPAGTVGETALADTVGGLMRDDRRRQAMAVAAATICDGRGARRVAKEIAS